MASNYHNKQNFSDFASPFSNNPDPMRRNFKFDEKQELRENQKNLQSMLDQLKKKDAESNNPFYDNTYKHNLNVLRGKPQDLSLDFQNPQIPSLSRISDIGPTSVRNDRNESLKKPPTEEPQPDMKLAERNEGPLLRDYDKKNSQGNNQGSFFDRFGENSRHKNIVKDYQDYMKNNPIPHPKDRNSGKYDERETNRISLKKKKEQQNNDWNSKDVGLGILPGMGAFPGTRSNPDRRGEDPQRYQAAPEYKPTMQDRQNYGFSEGRKPSGVEEYRREMSDMPMERAGPNMPNNRMNQNHPASRLASIGSRILDSERPYLEHMRTPQYTPNKDAMHINFATPQNQKSLEMGPNLAGRFREMQSYSNDSNRYGKEGYDLKEEIREDYGNFDNFREFKNQPSQEWNAPNEGRLQDFAKQGRQNDKRDERGIGNNNNNVNWLEERQKQEQDKKERQKEELQRIYREQIEEKKRKKEEEQRRQQQEEKKEEERLRKELDDLQKQYQLEQQKKKEEEEPKKSVPEDDYSTAAQRRQNKHKKQVETSSENTMKRVVPKLEYDLEKRPISEQEEMDLDYMIKEPVKKYDEQVDSRPRYEFSKDPEMEVQREVTRKMNATLDDELERMKRDVDYHSKLLRSELASYKTQAMVSQELRHNAQKELQRLREDLKNQQVQETREPITSFDLNTEKNRGKGQGYGLDKSEEKPNFKLPSKSYAKLFRPEDENPNFELSAAGLTLDFETKYVSAQEMTSGYNHFKEPEKLSELMKKYGVDDDTKKSPNRNDAAMKKFGALFPAHGKKPQSQGSLDAIEAKLGQLSLARKELSNPTDQRGFSYAKGLSLTRPKENLVKNSYREIEGEGEDEIERIESLLKKYRDPDLKFKEDKKPLKINIKHDQLMSNNRIINELDNDEFLASERHLVNNYEDRDDNYEVKETDRELANETQEVNVTNENDMMQNEDEQEEEVQEKNFSNY